MYEIYNIRNALALSSSRNEKERILKENAGNELLKTVFKYALDPFKQFYIKKIPSYGESTQSRLSLEEAIVGLDKLSSRQVTGNAAIEHLQNILERLHLEDRLIIEYIIQKDLKCGVSTATVNKVFGANFIPEWPVMKCEKFDKRFVDKFDWKNGVYAELKEDGVRVNIHVTKEGKVSVYGARSGKPVETLGVMDGECKAFLEPIFSGKFDSGLPFEYQNSNGYFLDGELLAVDEDGKQLPRKDIGGICNKAIKGTIKKAEALRLRVSIWDIIPEEHFHKAKLQVKLKDRRSLLGELHSSHTARLQPLVGVEDCFLSLTYAATVYSLSEADEEFKATLERGLEGIILKNPNAPWEDKRSQHFVKMKAEKFCELEVVDVVSGSGKYIGLIGALLCKTSDGTLTVNVGSGFSDAERSWGNFKVGDIISVKYNEVIKDRDGSVSLFLPIYLGKRIDKSVANTFEELE